MGDTAVRRGRVHRLWSVVLAAVLLLAFEALYLAVGLYALIYGSWEDLAAIGTIFGLALGVIGLLYLAFTIPALFGLRFARLGLAALTVPVAVLGMRGAVQLVAYPPDYTYDAGYWMFVTMGPPASTLLPLLAVVLLFLPPSQPFFVRGRRPI